MVDQQMYERTAQELLPTLYKIAIGMLRSDADARDAVQQALLKAWEKRQFAQADTFRGYLTRILINECHNVQRHRMRVFPAELPPLPTPKQADYRELFEAVHALPEPLKLAIWLKYLHNYSEKEAAQALGIPVTTFKMRLHRARQKLREMLDQEVMFE